MKILNVIVFYQNHCGKNSVIARNADTGEILFSNGSKDLSVLAGSLRTHEKRDQEMLFTTISKNVISKNFGKPPCWWYKLKNGELRKLFELIEKH